MREFYIAGVQFHELKRIINALEEGDLLTLVPEPTNKFDPNAVAIVAGDVMCGYVPKKFSAEISALIEVDGVDNLTCEIVELNPSAKPWEQCKVEITSTSDGIEGEDEEEVEGIE